MPIPIRADHAAAFERRIVEQLNLDPSQILDGSLTVDYQGTGPAVVRWSGRAEVNLESLSALFAQAAQDTRESAFHDGLPDLRPHCCPHEDDAHDGSGCLDCGCTARPGSANYRPTPSR